MKRAVLILFVLALLCVPFSLVFGQDASNTLRLATFLDTKNLNPILLSPGIVARLAWSPPFEIDRMTGLPVPGLTSWEIGEDGQTYTFTIRDGALWSDGTPITSSDFKFTFDAIGSDKVETTYKTFLLPPIESVTVVDDKTFEVKSKEVNCTFLNTVWGLLPLPAHEFAADFSDVMTHPMNTSGGVSSGQYVVTEYKPDEFVRFEANPNYWGGTAKIPNVTVQFLADTAVSNLALQTGEIDFLRMTASQFEQFTGKEDFNVYTVPNQFIAGLLWNHADPTDPKPALDPDGNPVEQKPHPILGDVRVRRAIAMGYDKAAILASIGDENAGVLINGSSVHPALTAWAYDTSLEPWPYDPEAAAALLDEAGWVMNDSTGIREKDGMPLSLEITYSPIYAEYNNIALVVQDQLKQIGIDIKVSSIDYGVLISEYLLPQKFDITVLSFGGFPADPDGLADAIFTRKADLPGAGFNIASYANPELDKLIEEGRSVPGCKPEDRAPIYHQIQKITRDDVIYDFIFVTNDYLVVNKRIQGFVPAAGEFQEFTNVNEWTLSQ